MKRTSILDLLARKLAPFMLLFGMYLLANGHVTPGGGFQAGVVIASGIILLALGRSGQEALAGLPTRLLPVIEGLALITVVALGAGGIIWGNGFLSPMGARPVTFLVMLNVLIGLKVGAGISLLCIALLREES